MQQFKNKSRRGVESSGGDDVQWCDFDVREVNTLDVEDRLTVAFSKLHAAIEQLGSVLDQIGPEISVDYRVAPGRQDEYLGYHILCQSVYKNIDFIQIDHGHQ